MTDFPTGDGVDPRICWFFIRVWHFTLFFCKGRTRLPSVWPSFNCTAFWESRFQWLRFGLRSVFPFFLFPPWFWSKFIFGSFALWRCSVTRWDLTSDFHSFRSVGWGSEFRKSEWHFGIRTERWLTGGYRFRVDSFRFIFKSCFLIKPACFRTLKFSGLWFAVKSRFPYLFPPFTGSAGFLGWCSTSRESQF